MKNTNRRIFIMQVAAGSSVLTASAVMAQAPMVSEKEPQAVALGYLADTSKVNAAKYPKHKLTQACKNCQLYQGKPTDAAGGCVLFAGKQVAGNGWCSAYNSKA